MLPVMENLGFRGYDPELEVYRPHDDLGRCFPCGRFRRKAPDGNIEQVEIQFDKRGGNWFRLCTGIVPHNGVNHPTLGFIKTSEAWVHYLPRYANLHRTRWLPIWFYARDDAESRYEAVEQATALLTEIDQWLRSRAVGPHLRVVSSYPSN